MYYRIAGSDAFTAKYNINQYVEGMPLAVSHMVQNKVPRRYDFIFLKNNVNVKSVKYLYNEACEASSDHAMVIADYD